MGRTKTIIIIGLFLLNSLIFPGTLSFNQIIFIHAFLFGIMILSEKAEKKIAKETNNIISFFLTINIIRGVLVILFLLPTIFFSYDNKIEVTLNFFIVYFLHILIVIGYKKNFQKFSNN